MTMIPATVMIDGSFMSSCECCGIRELLAGTKVLVSDLELAATRSRVWATLIDPSDYCVNSRNAGVSILRSALSREDG